MTTSSPMDAVTATLERLNLRFRRVGDTLNSQCPAHQDDNPSLSVTYDRVAGKVLVNCHVGCSPDDVVAALNLSWPDLFDQRGDDEPGRRRATIVAEYDYCDEQGVVLFQKVRMHPKDFRVRHPDGRGGWPWGIGDARRVLYRLPEVRAAVAQNRPVLVVEGEKDADRAAQQLGMAATCNYDGAAKLEQRPKWRREYAEEFRGARVVIVADNDPAGLAHARAIAASLRGVATEVGVFRPAVDFPKADLSDHLDAGHGIADLVPVTDATEAPDEKAPPQDGGRGVLVSLSTVQPERLTWLWEGRFPTGKIVLIDGDPSVGKSTLGVELAAHVSTGKPWPDGARCERGGVLILSAEDGLADTIRPRLDAAGGDPERVHALTAVRTLSEDGRFTERPPTLADIDVIADAIRQTHARMVLIDVMMAFLPGKVDSHKDQDIRSVLSRLTRVGEDTGCLFVLLRHLNKAAGGSPMYRGGGSIGIVGAARAAYLVARDPDDPDTRVMACVKSNLAREPESLTYRLESAPDSDVARVVWTGASTLDAAGLLSSNVDDTDDRTEVETWLRDLFDNGAGAVGAQDVLKAAKAAGFSVDQVKRAKKRLGAKSEKSSMGGGWSWVLSGVEGGTKGAKGAALRDPPPSLPSALPSESTPPREPWPKCRCGTDIYRDGATSCARCELKAASA